MYELLAYQNISFQLIFDKLFIVNTNIYLSYAGSASMMNVIWNQVSVLQCRDVYKLFLKTIILN